VKTATLQSKLVACSFLTLVCHDTPAAPVPPTAPQNISAGFPKQLPGRLLADAITGGDTAAARTLLERGINPNAPIARSDLSYAVSTPLIYAVTYRRPAIANLLLDKGADVNGLHEDPEDYEDVPLAYAASGADISMARLLLRRGANINGGATQKFTPLMAALFTRGFEAVAMARFLIAHNANVNRADAKGFTPLMLSRSHPEIVPMLLTHGARINTRAHDGTTALMMAAKGNGTPGGTAAVVRLLLAHGADPAARDKKGRTALMLATDPAVRQALTYAPAHH